VGRGYISRDIIERIIEGFEDLKGLEGNTRATGAII
jgi:hypothetical protein